MKQTRSGFMITQIKQLGGRIFDRRLTREGIDAFNGAQGRILYVLWQGDRVSMSELAQKTSLARNTLTSMLDRMETAGLVKRRPVQGDRRVTHIALTEKARALRKAYDRVSDDMSELYFAGFRDEEIDAFEGYLERIIHNLTEAIENE